MQNKNRFNNTIIKMNIFKALMSFFMVIIVFFSMLVNTATISNIEKHTTNLTYNSVLKNNSFPPSPSKPNIPAPKGTKMLQPPKADNTYSNKLLKDIDNLKYDDFTDTTTPSNNLVKKNTPSYTEDVSGSVNNSYKKGGHTFDTNHWFTFVFALRVNGVDKSIVTWDKWLDDNDTSGWVSLQLNFNVTNLKPSDSVGVWLNRVHVKGNWGWDADLSFNPVGVTEASMILAPALTSSVTSYSINSVTLHMNYDGSNESGYNDMNVEVPALDKATFNVTTNNYSETIRTAKIRAKKIFMSNADLNKSFTLATLRELITLTTRIPLMGSVDLFSNKSNISLMSNIKINKSTKQLEVTIKRLDISNWFWGKYYYLKPQTIKIPIIIVNPDYLFQGSLRSSSYWEHLTNGETRYHTTKPSTILELNNEYIKSLYILFHKNQVLNDVLSWTFAGTDKQTAIQKVKLNAINIFNYEEIKRKYSYNRNPNVFDQAEAPKFLNKYESVIFTGHATINDYLYILKNSAFSFKTGSTILSDHKASIKDIAKGINIKLTDKDIKSHPKFNTSWKVKVSNLQLIIPDENSIFKQDLKINLLDDNYDNYDLSLKYTTGKLETSITHEYVFQTSGIDISADVSFIMEDGTSLNENYIVIRPSSQSNLKVNDAGYIAVRYWASLSNNIQEYVILEKKSNSWYSPKYKQNILNLDPSFNIKNLEYVFNQDLQMIINPYSNASGKKPIDVVSAGGLPRYGIKVVMDELNGVTKELENWDDGLWSHSHGINGLPLFDGVFGADMNGMLDSKGRLSDGLHKINISLQNFKFKGLKQSFTIFIDKNPLNVKVSSPQGVLKTLNLLDQNNDAQKLYFSNQPISFEVKDIDLKDIQAKFIDGNGNWYDLPINIKSKMVNNKWTQTVTSTIDYAGFAKVTVYDQANNKSVLYFWLKQNKEDSLPKFDYDASKLFKDSKIKFLNTNLDIFNDLTSIKISSPLVSKVNISKLSLIDGSWSKVANNGDFTKNIWNPISSKNKSFGKTIDSSLSSLKFAGDELKPFISKNKDKKWTVTNEIIDFKQPGLYKINLQTNLIQNKTIDYYLYIKENALIPLNIKTALNDLSNFKQLPNQPEGDLDKLDKITKVLSDLNIKMPKFLIKDYQVSYSLPWYSDFKNILQPNLSFKKEGKYKISLTDIFNKKYDYEVLLIDKKLTLLNRKKQHLTPLSTPPPQLLSPYKDQLIFNDLVLDKEMQEMSFDFKATQTTLKNTSVADVSKTININASIFNQIQKNKVQSFELINNIDFNIKNSNFSIFLAVKRLNNGLLRSWLYTESDGRNNEISNFKFITFVNQIRINSRNSSINIFNNSKEASVTRNKTKWNRQALLLSGAKALKLRISDRDEIGVTKDKYGAKEPQITLNSQKINLKFTLFNLQPNTKKDKSFYKGKNVWSYFRYEDEDHLLWERDEFVKGAMWNGLTWEQAHQFYKKMKFDPKWNGDLGNLNWSNKDWKNKWAAIADKFEKVDPPKVSSNKFGGGDSTSSTISILIGTLSALAFIIAIYVIGKRIKGRKIR